MNPSPQHTSLLHGEKALQWLEERISTSVLEEIPVFLLADSHTYKHCFPVLQQKLKSGLIHFEVIVVDAGEQSKSLDNASLIWQKMLQANAGRDALLLCLGGGMITDLGGFAASVYKRGISLVYLPTSLLAMVDAAIGGKTAIDFKGIKNPVGSFYQPDAVLFFPEFLKTLQQREFTAGLAEVKKYTYIGNADIEHLMQVSTKEDHALDQMIFTCAKLKQDIVEKDPTEQGLRKILNFGHTIGHAIESFSFGKNLPLLHGEAVAIGMFCELWISANYFGYSTDLPKAYASWYLAHFEPWKFEKEDIPEIMKLMQQDKKNKGGRLGFVLIEKPGQPRYDLVVSSDRVAESLMYYLNLFF